MKPAAHRHFKLKNRRRHRARHNSCTAPQRIAWRIRLRETAAGSQWQSSSARAAHLQCPIRTFLPL